MTKPTPRIERANTGYPVAPEPYSPTHQRFVYGYKDGVTEVGVMDAELSTYDVAWPPDRRVLGTSQHPTDERALVSTGAALFEVNLDTCDVVELHADAGAICGYLDADHVVTFTARRVAVHRHTAMQPLGAPIATADPGGDWLWAGGGRCLVAKDGGVHLLEGAALRDGGFFPYVRDVERDRNEPLTRIDVCVEQDGVIWIGAQQAWGSNAWYRTFR